VNFLVLAVAILALGAVGAFTVRKHLWLVGPLSLGALVGAMAFLAAAPSDAPATVVGISLRLSSLGRLAGIALLATLALLVIDVWIAEPAYNFFPTALAVGATVVAVLTLAVPIVIYATLLFGLFLPVGSFTFQVHRNRSVEAAVRHFGFVTLGGSIGLAALALAAGLPKDEPPQTFLLLVVVLFVAFALKLAAIPFHTHAALLVSEAPVSALALYFGVLVPTTFLALAQILTLSGLLPAIVQIHKVQDLLSGIGLVSALGGALLASGAADLRRLVVYAVISNLGASLVGIATLSGPGIVGGIAIALVTGACATQQLLAAGALERRSGPDLPNATHAPLAAAAFVAGGAGMIGLPPLVSFPGHFYVELIAFAFSSWVGTALVAATLLLLVGQLRAGIALFSVSMQQARVEPRPVAGIVGLAISVALLAGGMVPDALLGPIATFADEFLKALRPL